MRAADWHYDAITPDHLSEGRGQRLATLLVYCNDVASGGHTAFRDLHAGSAGDGTDARITLRVQPRQGRALLFFPSDAGGEPDFRTIHAGEPAAADKYVAQLWVHEGRYDPEVPVGTSQSEGARLARSVAVRPR